MERRYGEVPSWAVREEGREGEDEKLRGSGEGSAVGRAREKNVFLVSREELTQISTSWVGEIFFGLVELTLTHGSKQGQG